MAIVWERIGELAHSIGPRPGKPSRKPIGVYYQRPNTNNKYTPKGLAKAYKDNGSKG